MERQTRKTYHACVVLCRNGSYHTYSSREPLTDFYKIRASFSDSTDISNKPIKLLLISPIMTEPDAMYTAFRLDKMSKKNIQDLKDWYVSNTLKGRMRTGVLDSEFIIKVQGYPLIMNKV